jgi:hypothetical protein
MQIAIAVGALLLSGVVLGEPDEEDTQATPDQAAPAATPGPSPSYGPETTPPGQQMMPGPGGRSQQGMRRRTPMYMPSSPTDRGGMMGQPGAPTSPGPTGGGGAENLGPGAFGTRQPIAPTASPYRPRSHTLTDQGRRTPNVSGSAALMIPGGLPQTGQTMQNMQGGLPAATEKAFSSYRPPSGISPYMNLFRTGNALGTIDNYTTLVRPELDQRYLNRQLGQDVQGMQQRARMQQLQMQQLNQQQNRAPQGIGTPQFYMNYGNFYPGYGQ